jgi:hypothetical protein
MTERNDGKEMMDEFELTPEEKMAFQRLPTEAEPSRILEERVVKGLREEGILATGEMERSGQGQMAEGGGWYRPWMAVASIAASLVLFASGVVMGQWMGSQSTTQAFIQVREQDAAQLALRIQEAGTAYVSALAALSELRNPVEGEGGVEGGASMARVDLQQGREVALGALYGAANELARLSPDDADVLRVLQILEERQAREEGRGGDDRNVVWF